MWLDPDVCYRALASRDRRFDGRFFVAVSSTGIYCRPICPVRTPHRENVTFFPTAAAAQEAGYRPCLRCRPETAPYVGAWHGTLNTVSRAIALIESGALDGADIEALAERVGVGGRQLRRLFQEHVGASPLTVAQTRRILLAKQLIHETRLPMTEVALAAGFGSVRRFNDTFRRLYGRPPGALRRRGTARDGSSIQLTLSYKPPYDWDAMIAFLAGRAIPGVEEVSPVLYGRSLAEGTIAVSHDAAHHRLVIGLELENLGSLQTILPRVRRVFDLDADPEIIGAHLAKDPMLAPFVAQHPGLRVPGGWDPFELALRAIVGQQITVSGARQLLGKLVAAYGEPKRGHNSGNKLTHVFPTPDRLVGRDIASIGMPGARGRAIENLAQAAAANPALFDRGAALEETISRLSAIPGIGNWTAHYIAIRGLREPDGFPASDIGLLRAMAKNGARPSARELQARAETWRPWRAYAAQHLWTHDSVHHQIKEEQVETLAREIEVPYRNHSARV